MQLTGEQEEIEKNNVDHLASIANVDVQVARRVFRKHKGDMEKAVDALLAGDVGQEVGLTAWDGQRRNTPEPLYGAELSREQLTVPHSNAPLPSSSVIDLTVDDDEMARALELSMQESSQTLPQFGPSERAPHPEWQMVRADVTYTLQVTSRVSDKM